MTIAPSSLGWLFDGEGYETPPIFMDGYADAFVAYLHRTTAQPVFLAETPLPFFTRYPMNRLIVV